MASVLVFAGTSFIGRHIIDCLKRDGHSVVGTSRRGGHDPIDPADMPRCDITQREQVDSVIESVRPDWIIQCAAATSTTDPFDLYPVHVGGTLHVLDAAKRVVPDARLLIMGSAAEYGPVREDQLPVSETCVCAPPAFFGASKLAQTELAFAAAAVHRQHTIVVRPFNVIGPGLPDFYFAKSLILRLLKQRREAPATVDFEIVNADSTRDFVDVRDVARAVAMLLAQDDIAPPGAANLFNICTGTETSLMDVAQLLGELAGSLKPLAAGSVQSRGGIVRSVGSCRKLTAATGWTPQIDWRESITDLWTETIEKATDTASGK